MNGLGKWFGSALPACSAWGIDVRNGIPRQLSGDECLGSAGAHDSNYQASDAFD
jgi:hypothetical protein